LFAALLDLSGVDTNLPKYFMKGRMPSYGTFKVFPAERLFKGKEIKFL